MTAENTKVIGLPEARKLVKGWAQIGLKLPANFDPTAKHFLRDYFRAQLRISQGKSEKARKIFAGLTKRVGYDKFEEKYESYLAAVDLAVKGQTRWDAEPAFTLNEKSSL